MTLEILMRYTWTLYSILNGSSDSDVTSTIGWILTAKLAIPLVFISESSDKHEFIILMKLSLSSIRNTFTLNLNFTQIIYFINCFIPSPSPLPRLGVSYFTHGFTSPIKYMTWWVSCQRLITFLIMSCTCQ